MEESEVQAVGPERCGGRRRGGAYEKGRGEHDRATGAQDCGTGGEPGERAAGGQGGGTGQDKGGRGGSGTWAGGRARQGARGEGEA